MYDRLKVVREVPVGAGVRAGKAAGMTTANRAAISALAIWEAGRADRGVKPVTPARAATQKARSGEANINKNESIDLYNNSVLRKNN
jgi:hypothetical protein